MSNSTAQVKALSTNSNALLILGIFAGIATFLGLMIVLAKKVEEVNATPLRPQEKPKDRPKRRIRREQRWRPGSPGHLELQGIKARDFAQEQRNTS